MPGGLLVAAFFFCGGVGIAGRARSYRRAQSWAVGAGRGRDGGVGVVFGGGSGRWSVRGGVPKRSEGSARSARGNDRRAKWCARRTLRWGGRGVQGAAGWGRAGAGCWANRNGPAAEAAGPGGTLASGGVIRPGFCGDGPRRPDRPDRCRRAAWWRVRGLP